MSIAEKFATMEYGPAPEDPKEALAWLERHERRFGLFIGGAWRAPAAGEYFDTLDPSTGEKLASVAQGGPADIDAAVQAAREASPKWRALTPHVRARYLYALARQVQKHSRLLAVLETMDNGKPIRESRDIDIPLVARHFYYHAGWAQLAGSGISGVRAVRRRGTDHSLEFSAAHAGVEDCAGAGDRKHGRVEAGGVHAAHRACICRTLPGGWSAAGVVNIVTGDGSTGEALVKHPDVDKIAFTGSTEVGRAIRRATAASHKRLSLELGGKSPFIIFEDADLDSAVEGLVDGIWFNQGQVCCAGSRLLMQESIAEPLIAKIRDRMSTLRIGPPLDKAIDIGAIVARVQLERIQAHGRAGSRGRRDLLAAGNCAAVAWTLLSSDASQQCASDLDRRAAGDLRPGARCDDVPHSARSRRTGQQHRVRTGLLRVEREHQCRSACRRTNQGRRGVGELHEPVRRSLRLRRISRERLRTRRRTRRSARVHGAEVVQARAASLTADGAPDSRRSRNRRRPATPAIDRTVKLYIGGKQARPDSGYSMEVRSPDGASAR